MLQSTIARSFSKFARELQHCVCCQQLSSQLICHACQPCIETFKNENTQSFINTRPDVAKRLPTLRQHRLTVIGPHKSLLMNLINQFKYGKKQILAAVLASLLSEKILANYTEQTLPELLIPVPMHPVKRLFRGFNQTETVCQNLVSVIGIELSSNTMARTRYSNPQAGKSGEQRRRMAQTLFKVKDIATIQRLSHIAVLDDVITTGTTMYLVIKALKKVNPKLEIDLWSLSVSL